MKFTSFASLHQLAHLASVTYLSASTHRLRPGRLQRGQGRAEQRGPLHLSPFPTTAPHLDCRILHHPSLLRLVHRCPACNPLRRFGPGCLLHRVCMVALTSLTCSDALSFPAAPTGFILAASYTVVGVLSDMSPLTPCTNMPILTTQFILFSCPHTQALSWPPPTPLRVC